MKNSLFVWHLDFSGARLGPQEYLGGTHHTGLARRWSGDIVRRYKTLHGAEEATVPGPPHHVDVQTTTRVVQDVFQARVCSSIISTSISEAPNPPAKAASTSVV